MGTLTLISTGVKFRDLNLNSNTATMKSFAVVAMLVLACVASSMASDCDDSLPKRVCDHLDRLENNMGRLANRSITLISKAVENAAEGNARLFQKTVEYLRTSSAAKQKNSTELAKLLKDLTETFEQIKEAQQDAAEDAMKAIEAASMKVATLIQQIIDEAADADHSDKAEFRRKLHMAVVKAHVSIRKATLEAIVTVQKKNHRARVYVYRMLKKLGVSMISDIAPVVDQMSDATNQQFAAEAEKELEADFDGTVDEAYQVIVATDSGVSKRGWSDFWGKVKAKFQQLGSFVLAKIKEVAKTVLPKIYEKLREIGKIILDAAKQVIVEVARQILVVAKSG